MSKKSVALLASFAVAVAAVAALAARPSEKSGGCCYPGSECCYPGSPCCEAECCSEGSSCCNPPQACCLAAPAVAAKAGAGCCEPGAECCYPGSPCCEADCCYEGSPCCVEGAACCTVAVSAAVPEVAAAKGCCKADAKKAGGCCGKGCCSAADAKKADEKKVKAGHCGKCEMCTVKSVKAAEIVPADATVIAVEGMDCPSCAKKVVAKLTEVAGVEKAVADVKASKLTVTPKAKAAPSAKAMWEAVEKAGYKPTKLEGPAGKFAATPKE